jgi:hypothetical protein
MAGGTDEFFGCLGYPRENEARPVGIVAGK